MTIETKQQSEKRAKRPLRQHSEAFKRDAVRLLEMRGSRTADAIAAEVDVVTSQLYDWKTQYGSQIAGTGLETLDAEVKRLRKEVAQLRKEREFIKKTAAFFARENK